MLESKILELTVAHEILTKDHEDVKSEKEALSIELNDKIRELKEEFEQLREEKDTEIQSLSEKIQNQETEFTEQVALKDATIAEAETNIQKLKDELEELQKEKQKEKEDMDNVISERERERQVWKSVTLSEMCVDTPRCFMDTFSLYGGGLLCFVSFSLSKINCLVFLTLCQVFGIILWLRVSSCSFIEFIVIFKRLTEIVIYCYYIRN